jgi:tetratricopeptide (TPR) repeat protein
MTLGFDFTDEEKGAGRTRIHPRVVGLALALVTLLAYLPATQNGFLNYDDDAYVTANSTVQNGLTLAGIKWAFAGYHVSNWHPLTWVSHMVDCNLFRLNPAGHHLVNILFHAANTFLLFVLIRRMTGTLWSATAVAALFAWHPLHVESVAWVAERKDVLSTLFGLLSLLAYERYVRENNRWHYAGALIFFALSLLSKPMLVTLPMVMLLLDYWPWQRLQKNNLPERLLEKTPYIFLAAIFCVVTFLAQRHEAVASLQRVSLGLRLENSTVAYVDYLTKTFWPVDLAAFYPLPKMISWLQVAVAAAVLSAISTVVWLAGHRRPYLRVGWLWYLGTLVPVIGLVQVGDQALADRYTYFPLVGIFIMLTFAAADFVRQFQFSKPLVAALTGLIFIACLGATGNQLRYWRDSETLFTHALAVTRDNPLAHLNLGAALQQQQRTVEAMAEYRKTLQLDPAQHEAYNNIGRILHDAGKPAEALPYCLMAARLDPQTPASHDSFGIVLAELGRFTEAHAQFAEAVRLDPEYAPAHFQIGRTFLMQGRDAEALPPFREALRLDPNNVPMLLYIARVMAANQNPAARAGTEAVQLSLHIAQLMGDNQPVALDTLAMAYAEAGRFADAVQTAQQAIQFAQPGDLAAMRQRLEFYQKHQPWRESFVK